MNPWVRCQLNTPHRVCLWVWSRRHPNGLVYPVKTMRGIVLARYSDTFNEKVKARLGSCFCNHCLRFSTLLFALSSHLIFFLKTVVFHCFFFLFLCYVMPHRFFFFRLKKISCSLELLLSVFETIPLVIMAVDGCYSVLVRAITVLTWTDCIK